MMLNYGIFMKSTQSYLPTNYWIMKSEPGSFSFPDLLERKEEFWDGVRNYQARNFMRDNMHVGDKVLFYHSNASPSGIAGICEVVKTASPDPTALNPKSKYYDPKSTKENNRWCAVTVGRPKPIKKFLTLNDLRDDPILSKMLVLKRGQRLSVLPVSKQEWDRICQIVC